MVWIIDETARTVYANERMAEILGTSRAEMVRQRFFNHVLPEDISALQWFDSRSYGDMQFFRFRLRRSDGSLIGVVMQRSPMLDASGVVVGTIGTFRVVENADTSNETRPEARHKENLERVFVSSARMSEGLIPVETL
jgi:PAS domain S-box-containing protein